jgi:hypothetical protein
MNPLSTIYFRLASIAVAVILIGLAYHHVEQSGFDRANSIWIEKTAKADKAAQEKLDQANAKAKEITDSLQALMAQRDVEQYKELQNAKTTLAAVRNGTRRLSVQIPASACNTAGNSENSTASSLGDAATITAELSAETSRSLADIADTGDSAIIRLNACLDSYSAISSQVGKSPTAALSQ